MPPQKEFCHRFLNKQLYQNVHIADAFASILQLVGIGIVLMYMRYINRQARGLKDSSSTAVYPFLPIYELYVRAIFVLSCFWAVFGILPETNYLFSTTYGGYDNATYPDHKLWVSTRIVRSVFVGMNWGSFHTLFWFVLALLCQPGMGMVTVRRASKISIGVGLWTGVTFCLSFLFQSGESTIGPIIYSILIGSWQIFMAVSYLIVWLVPQRLLPFHRRPAARTYAAFWSVLRVGSFLSTLLSFLNEDLSLCGHWLFDWLLFGLFWPVTMVLTFRLDTEYWHGGFRDPDPGPCACWGCRRCYSSHYQRHAIIGDRNIRPKFRTRSSLPEDDVRRPLFDLDVSQKEASAVRHGMDSIPHSMLIPYCNLHIDAMRILGTGGTSNVYRGEFVKRCHVTNKMSTSVVAIKMLTCFELTPDVVDSFFQEAVVLYEHSNHPNIVKCHGITVAPPTMCIVLECCDGDLTTLLSRRAHEEKQATMTMTTMTMSNVKKIKELERFFTEAIQCATAVAYLHSQSPPILHRDIKSPNYLLSMTGVIKLADLGLAKMTDLVDSSGGGGEEAAPSPSPSDEYTLAWAAPELIAGGQATESSDIYALILVLWELMHPGQLPFDDPSSDYWETKKKIQEGERPSLHGLEAMVAGLVVGETEGCRLREEARRVEMHLRAMFEDCWDHNPMKRWSAEKIVEALNEMLKQSYCIFSGSL